jgi:hypothetical protein
MSDLIFNPVLHRAPLNSVSLMPMKVLELHLPTLYVISIILHYACCDIKLSLFFALTL